MDYWTGRDGSDTVEIYLETGSVSMWLCFDSLPAFCNMAPHMHLTLTHLLLGVYDTLAGKCVSQQISWYINERV
jgi:hypothetical protein